MSMVRTLRQARSGLWFTLRRLRSRWALSLAVVLTMGALIGVWVGIPLYAESASSRLLSIEVDDAAADDVPFGYLFSYNRLSGGNQSWSDFAPLNELVSDTTTPFGSSVRAQRRVITSITFDLVDDVTEPSAIETLSFVSATAFDDDAVVTQGRLAQEATSLDEPIEVMIDEDLAETNGIAANQRLTIVNRRTNLDDPNRAFDIVVAGIWARPVVDDAAAAPADPATRFLRIGVLTGNLVVPEATIKNVIDPLSEASLTNAQWLVLLDSATVTTDSVDTLLANTDVINRQVDDRLRGARVLVSPESSLQGFQDDVADLNRGLALFSIPTLALVLAVAGLLISMRWSRQLGEVAMLRRRGVPAGQIIAEATFEAVLLAAASAVVGFFAARVVATFMARTETFLRLGDGVNLDLVMNSRSWRALAVAAIGTVTLLILPSFGSLRQSVLSTDSGSATSLRMPWWQRARLDLGLILGIAFFSWFLLRRDALRGDLLDDPIVILLPALNALAAGLLVLRLVPLLMRGVAALLARTDNTAALLVARRTSRVPAAMAAPLLLLVITGALAIYTGSLAKTLDLQLFDVAHHSVGANNSVRSGSDPQLGQRFVLPTDDNASLRPLPPGGPVIDPRSFDNVWGVSAVSRFTVLPARLTPSAGSGSTESVPVDFTGIDTTTFTDVAFWRSDYSSAPLAELVARLEATPDSLLITNTVLRRAGLRLGDRVEVSVRNDGRSFTTDMVIVGTFDQFPTWIPGDGLPPAVGSLVDFEARSGSSVVQNVLYDASADNLDVAQTRADLSRLGISSAAPQRPSDIVERNQLRPERQGIFGLLTVSFAVSAALTIAGFMFYAVFGFTRQLTELGVLRALGLRLRDLMALVAFDLFIVAAAGVGAGTLVGLAMARWYLPELIDDPVGSAPRLLEEIDWSAAVGIPVLLAGVLSVVTLALLMLLRRIRLFEAIKVGGSQ